MPTLHWVGKDKVKHHHRDVAYRVLNTDYGYQAPAVAPSNSVDNRIIRGDNLEALKSLLPEFEGKVKCIYIDPPYNTGNEGCVYNDNVNDPRIKKWLGQVVGKEGEDMSRHDKWLCMMYPRLKLLHRLLDEDGFIFISIDAFEFGHLKIVLDEVFGTQNFRNCIAVRRGVKNVQSQFEDLQALSLGHEYIFLYSKSCAAKLPKLTKAHEEIKPGKWDTFWRGTDRPTMRYEIFGISPTSGQWRWESVRTGRAIKNYQEFLALYSGKVELDNFFIDHLQATNEKLDFVRLSDDGVAQYYVPPQGSKLANDQWMDITLSGAFTDFDTEKNVALLDRILQWVTGDYPESIILDSFAGSGTTAHAVLKLNAQDGGNRRFILIEMMDYAETLTAERVRRVMSGYGEGSKAVAGLGGGFCFQSLGEPLFDEFQYLNPAVGLPAIRDYVAYQEGIPAEARATPDSARHPYWLGEANGQRVFFCYEPERITTLDLDLLAELVQSPGPTLIYADQLALGEDFMRRYKLRFKKIPRDITRL